MKKGKLKTSFVFVFTAIALVIVFFLAVNTGGLNVSVSQLVRGIFFEYDENVAIILQMRFPRVIVAILGGAIMAMSGVLVQSVMRNPLADPGIIGVTSGAAFSAVIVSSFFPSLAVFLPLFSFAGGMIAFIAVFMLAWNKDFSPVRLILTGVAIDAFFTGLYQGFNSFTGSNYSGAASIINANISLKTWDDVYILLIYGVICVVLSLLVAGRCNLISLSDKTVMSLGININKTRLMISVLSVLVASVFTAIVGAVSFLGLIVPHVGRMLVGSDHKKLLPYSALLGSLVLLIADTLGRTIAYPYEISASIIFAIIGGPLLVVILRKNGTVFGK